MNIRRTSFIFVFVTFVYLLYGAFYIWNTSFVLQGKRYFCLFDDAMISMQYAKTFASGHGLVWFPGADRVEGFTNPGWVAYMTIIHLVNLDPGLISLPIQISGMLILIANLYFVKRISDILVPQPLVGLGAVVFTAFNLPLNTWSLQGTEVSILTLLMSVVVYLTLRNLKTNRFSILPYLLLGAGTLIRIDMFVPYIGISVFLAFNDRRHWKRHIFWALVILVAFIIPQTLFRLWYYGDLLPNTYYLKVEGYPAALRWLQGANVASDLLARIGVIPLGWLLIRRDRLVRLLYLVFLAQFCYSIYVGGDAWDWWSYGANRYVSIAMPLYFILLCGSLHAFYQFVCRRIALGRVRLGNWIIQVTLSIVLIFSFIHSNTDYGDRNLLEWALLKPGLNVYDNRNTTAEGLFLKSITNDQARIAVVRAGALPYFAVRPAVDMLGKSDRKLAHMNAHSDSENNYFALGLFLPGHMKWDYGYSVGELKPDIVSQLWRVPWDADHYLKGAYTPFRFENEILWLLNGSPRIMWDKVNSVMKPIPYTFWDPQDGRIASTPWDHFAVWCNASATPSNLDIWRIDDDGTGSRLVRFDLADIAKAGAAGVSDNLGELGAVSATLTPQGSFWVAWRGQIHVSGHSFYADGQPEHGFAKGFKCAH